MAHDRPSTVGVQFPVQDHTSWVPEVLYNDTVANLQPEFWDGLVDTANNRTMGEGVHIGCVSGVWAHGGALQGLRSTFRLAFGTQAM